MRRAQEAQEAGGQVEFQRRKTTLSRGRYYSMNICHRTGELGWNMS